MQGDADFGFSWVLCKANTTIFTSAFEQTFINVLEVPGSYSSGRGQPYCEFTLLSAGMWTVSFQHEVRNGPTPMLPPVTLLLPNSQRFLTS